MDTIKTPETGFELHIPTVATSFVGLITGIMSWASGPASISDWYIYAAAGLFCGIALAVHFRNLYQLDVALRPTDADPFILIFGGVLAPIVIGIVEGAILAKIYDTRPQAKLPIAGVGPVIPVPQLAVAMFITLALAHVLIFVWRKQHCKPTSK